jgi:hypothetical protein
MNVYVYNCVNTGAIYSKATSGSSYYPYTGGIYSYASLPKIVIERCLNVGEITSVGGLDSRPGGIISVMNAPNDKSLYCKDCLSTDSLSAYIVNPIDGCVDMADPVLVEAAIKSVVDSITFAYIDINGFDTSRSYPDAPIELFTVETEKKHNVSNMLNGPDVASDSTETEADAYRIISIAALSIMAVCSVCIVVLRIVKRKK